MLVEERNLKLITYLFNTVPLNSYLPGLFLGRTRVSPSKTRVKSRENHRNVYFGINCKQLASEKTINFSQHSEASVWFCRLLFYIPLQGSQLILGSEKLK